MGPDPDPTEIKTISIPAGLDRDVPFRQAVAVVAASVREQLDPLMIELEQRAVCLHRELRGTRPMMTVAAVVDSLAVVKERK